MVQYDANIIYKFAQDLYRSARRIIITYTLVGAILGLVIGYLPTQSFGLSALIGALLLGLIGYALGEQRAFHLRLQAQIALCQVKIEENTR